MATFQITSVYQLRPGLLRVRVLVAFRGHFSGITVVYQNVEGQSISCVPRSVCSYNSCVSVVSHAAGVKMEPVKFAEVIPSEKGKDLLVIKGFKFHFHKILADNMERWCCTNKKCKCYTYKVQ